MAFLSSISAFHAGMPHSGPEPMAANLAPSPSPASAAKRRRGSGGRPANRNEPGLLGRAHCVVDDVRHAPPPHDMLQQVLARFDRPIAPRGLSNLRQIQAGGAVHHRSLWVHPFLDGNGRVARLISHALLKRLGVGTGLWSVARGLAREQIRYKQLLMAADAPRESDRDGKGNLTQRGLVAFSQFFLELASTKLSL